MAYDLTKITNLEQLKKLAARAEGKISALESTVGNAIQAATYTGNTLKLFRTTDTTGTAAFSFDLPEEMFLDQNKTKFVGDFKWTEAAYPGSTDPDLDGKQVMVLAVKGDDSVTYSFLDMSTLVDTYGAADRSVTVNGYTIKVNISEQEGNALKLNPDGLYVAHQDISGKADKVEHATSGNFAGLDDDGNLTDSGKKAADFAAADHAHDDKADKVAGGNTNGKLAGLDENGNLTNSGIAASEVVTGAIATNAEVDEMLDEVFGAAS